MSTRLSKFLFAHIALVASMIGFVVPAQAATVTIGSSGCNYIGFQFALDQLATIPGPHEIRLRSQTFSVPDGLTLNTSNRDWTFRGGFASCGDANPTAGQRSIIDASGGNNGTALAINADNPNERIVSLSRVTVRGGSAETGPLDNPEGGGMEIRGHATVLLTDDTRVEANASGKGGGVYIKGRNSSDRATILLVERAEISGNSAQTLGGGIYCDDNASIFLDNGEVSFNSAGETGGGLFMRNACELDSYVIADSFTGINANEAVNAAGIYAETTRPMNLRGASNAPFWFIGNIASSTGGALTVVNRGTSRAIVNLYSTVFLANESTGLGAAMEIGGGVDVSMRPNNGHSRCSFFGVDYDACSGVVGNDAGQGFASIIDLHEDGGSPSLSVSRTAITDNEASWLLNAFIDSNVHGIDIEGSLINRNFVTAGLFIIDNTASSPSSARLAWSTVAGNTRDTVARYIFRHFASPLNVTGTIIYNPEFFGRSQSTGAVTHSGCLLLDDNGTWPSTPVPPRVGNPALNSDLMPSPNSPAVDVCATSGAPATDFHGDPRVVNQASVPNLYGPVDLGAIELAFDDTIFANGFE